MNEEAAAQDYLVTYLSSDDTLMGMLEGGVYLRSTPRTASMPVVKIDRLDASDLMVVGLHRVWDDLTFLIRGVVRWSSGDQQDWTDVRAIADRVDALLHDHEETTSELEVHSFREESFTDETTESGDLFLHAGGIYRLRARAV